MAADAQAQKSGDTLVTLLGAATAVLAVAVAVLVWNALGEPPSNGPDPEKIAEAVSKRLAKDGYLKEETFNRRMNSLDQVVSSLLTAANFERAVDDLKRALENTCCGVPGSPRIWVLFENAKLEDDETGARSPRERLTAASRGIAIGDREQARLNVLAAALRACAVGDRRVRLNIQGYSSTREFVDAQGRAMPDSQALNLEAANLRAEGVISHLRGQKVHEENGVDIHHVPWQNYAAIRRPFRDSDDEIDGTDQERLNRVVLVELHDAGACAVEAVGGGNAR